MSMIRPLLYLSMIVLLVGGIAACGAQPYALNTNEFNRDSADFGKDPTDISEVIICYRSSSTTPDAVRVLAMNECAVFGKAARFIGQDYLSCPLATPVAANFACDSPSSFTGFGYSP